MVLTLALIPAFSQGEKENRSPRLWNVVRRKWQERRRANGKRTTAIPSPWGEGRGEGGRKNKFGGLGEPVMDSAAARLRPQER